MADGPPRERVNGVEARRVVGGEGEGGLLLRGLRVEKKSGGKKR